MNDRAKSHEDQALKMEHLGQSQGNFLASTNRYDSMMAPKKAVPRKKNKPIHPPLPSNQ
jgi:hypothetical protein